MKYKNIMIAIDGSDLSYMAIDEIINRTKDETVKLRLVHVVDESFVYHGGPGFDYLTFIAACRAEGQKILDKAAKLITKKTSLQPELSLIELKPLQGRIAEAIIDEANLWPADLLVIGTHGRRGFSRLFLGSVAENMVRIATMPVLLIRGKE